MANGAERGFAGNNQFLNLMILRQQQRDRERVLALEEKEADSRQKFREQQTKKIEQDLQRAGEQDKLQLALLQKQLTDQFRQGLAAGEIPSQTSKFGGQRGPELPLPVQTQESGIPGMGQLQALQPDIMQLASAKRRQLKESLDLLGRQATAQEAPKVAGREAVETLKADRTFDLEEAKSIASMNEVFAQGASRESVARINARSRFAVQALRNKKKITSNIPDEQIELVAKNQREGRSNASSSNEASRAGSVLNNKMDLVDWRIKDRENTGEVLNLFDIVNRYQTLVDELSEDRFSQVVSGTIERGKGKLGMSKLADLEQKLGASLFALTELLGSKGRQSDRDLLVAGAAAPNLILPKGEAQERVNELAGLGWRLLRTFTPGQSEEQRKDSMLLLRGEPISGVAGKSPIAVGNFQSKGFAPSAAPEPLIDEQTIKDFMKKFNIDRETALKELGF